MKIELDDVYYVTETKLTIRGSRRRTTIPKQVVDRLSLSDSDRLRWVLLCDGRVLLTKVVDPC